MDDTAPEDVQLRGVQLQTAYVRQQLEEDTSPQPKESHI